MYKIPVKQSKLAGKVLLNHVLVCSFFLVLPLIVSTRPPGEPFLSITRPLIRDITGNVLLLGFFYFSYYFLVPRYYITQKYVPFTVFILFFLISIIILPSLITGRFEARTGGPPPFRSEDMNIRSSPPNPLTFLFDELRHHLYLFAIAVFVSVLLRTRKYLSEVKEEKLKAELSSLKSQINPHFLFNTLNNIYILSLKKDDRVSDAIINLSGLMRYVIKDAHDYKIPLHKEIEYIQHYINLQKNRLGSTADIFFNSKGDSDNLQISPLILITYIENAFKFGVNPDVPDCKVNISLNIEDSRLTLNTSNLKAALSGEQKTTGIGMSNTEERLKLLYRDKYTLAINSDEETYSLNLTIVLS